MKINFVGKWSQRFQLINENVIIYTVNIKNKKKNIQDSRGKEDDSKAESGMSRNNWSSSSSSLSISSGNENWVNGPEFIIWVKSFTDSSFKMGLQKKTGFSRKL